ncbi:MAG TPA: oligosaccharide flippase family protein [Steroidobacteraceae bacterium]|jgi:O-antigen/teichoic acid export membrane protein
MLDFIARFIPSTLRSRLASGVAWVTLDAVASRGVMLVVMLVAARILGASNFGELTAVLSSVTLFGAFVGESMRVTAIKQIASADLSDSTRAGQVFGLTALIALSCSGVVSIVLWLLSDFVATDALNAPHLASGLKTAVLLVFMDTIGAAQRGTLMGLGAPRTMAFASVCSGGVAAALAIAVGHRADVHSYVLLLTAASAAGAIFRGIDIRRRISSLGIRIAYRVPAHELSVLWRFSLPAVLNSLTWAPINWLGMTMLANQPNGFSQIGLLGVATQWFACLLFFPNIIANALLPMLSRAYATGSHQAVARMLRLCIRSNLLLSIPAAILIAVASPWIVRDLYGPSFAGGASTLCLVVAAAAPASLLNLLGYVLAAKDRMWDSFLAGVVWAAVYLAAAYFGVGLGWGANALACAMLVAYSAKLGTQIWLFQRSRMNMETEPAAAQP